MDSPRINSLARMVSPLRSNKRVSAHAGRRRPRFRLRPSIGSEVRVNVGVRVKEFTSHRAGRRHKVGSHDVGVPEDTAPLSKLCGGWVAPVVPTHQGAGSNSAGWRITKVSSRGNTCRTVTMVTEGDVPSGGAVVIHGKLVIG